MEIINGNSNIYNSTFTNNIESYVYGGGGAIYNYNSTMIINNDTFDYNNATNGGAVWNVGNLIANNSTFLNNTANNQGGAIDNYDNALLNFNRIIGNNASLGDTIYNYAGTVDASLNWWGSNGNPYGNVAGIVNVSPWLVLTVTANPNILPNNFNSTVTADLQHDSNCNIHDSSFGEVPGSTPVTFNTTLGTINPHSILIIPTIFNSGSKAGFATISATVDNQTVQTLVTILDTIPPTANSNISNGTYNTTQNVTLTMNEPGTIYYTTDGTTPTYNSNRYQNPINIQNTTTLQYYAIDLNGNTSPTYSNTYTINLPPVTPLTASSNLDNGTYNTTQNITLTMNEPGTIYYTTDGTTPTYNSNRYQNPINIQNTTTLQYYAIDLNGNTSPTYSNTYTINLPPVTPLTASSNLDNGTYNTTQNVTLTMNEPGTIYYTTDGTTPTYNSNRYQNPINIQNTTTLQYYAIDLNGNTSPTYSNTYTINLPPVTPLTASSNLDNGTYNTTQNVTLTMNEPGTIYYTTDGTTPTYNSNRYQNPINIQNTTTLQYYAIDLNGNTSPTYSNTYTINLPPVTPLTASSNLDNGTYNTTQNVTLTMNEPGTIYYTTDGSTPTFNSVRYTSPILISKSSILKFFAMDLTGKTSLILTNIYTIDTIPPIANVNPTGSLYNINKVVTLTMNESGNIYYTLNGTIPTNKSILYTKPLTISTTTVLKYLAVDLAGNNSPVYTQTYTIDKIAPKVLSTSPKNLAQGIPKTTTITLKFNKNFKISTNWSKIYVKNLTTGKLITINKIITGSTLTIKTSTKSANHWYQIYLPTAAVKDNAGNNNIITTFKYKTI